MIPKWIRIETRIVITEYKIDDSVNTVPGGTEAKIVNDLPIQAAQAINLNALLPALIQQAYADGVQSGMITLPEIQPQAPE